MGSDMGQLLDGLMSLIDSSLPVHLLKGREHGFDIQLFVSYFHVATGRQPTLIKPSDLRLIPCRDTSTGQSLYCMTGVDPYGHEVLEEVHQIGLELHQNELGGLSALMLREISLRCFNDFRTVFLVHDKRMLGIVLEELENLVQIQQVLSPAQAEILRSGITPTINPGTRNLQMLIKRCRLNPEIKNGFLLKPVRSGKGRGVRFGSDLDAGEWVRELELLQSAEFVLNKTLYVIQRRIQQPRFAILLHGEEKVQHNYLVGTYMSIHGKFLGLGLWRTSSSPICALSQGGTWICSIVPAQSVDVDTSNGHHADTDDSDFPIRRLSGYMTSPVRISDAGPI